MNNATLGNSTNHMSSIASNHLSSPYQPQMGFNEVFNGSMPSISQSTNHESLRGDSTYLQPFSLPQVSVLDFNTFLTSNFDSNDLQETKQAIISLPNVSDLKHSIGPFCFFTQLIELSNNFDPNLRPKMLSQYKRLYSTIYKWRKVKGDGNCYYRAVIFSYLEHIILTSNLPLIQSIICDIKQCYDTPIILDNSFINSTTQIKPQLLLKVMILIYVALKKNLPEAAYEIFNKAINSCIHFDYGLVLYFRFILYRYIKANECKFYKKDFGVQIGNLLPSQFETQNGLFLFDAFYRKYLLKMNQDTEKIVIYLTPYVLCCKVSILLFDCEYENNHNEFDYAGREDNREDDFSVLLIANKEHYEVGYCKNYYSRYKDLFKSYKAKAYSNIILTEINNEEEERNDIDLISFQEKAGSRDIISFSNGENNTDSDLMHLQGNGQLPIQSNGNSIMPPSSMLKCLKCNMSTQALFQPFGICYQCFNIEFLSQIANAYLKSQKSFRAFFQSNKNPSEYIKRFGYMFNSTKITIHKREISIDQAIQLHNQSSPSKIYLNTYLTQIKATKCLNCTSEILNPTTKVSLPCMCFMCSGQCLNEYYSSVNKVEPRRQKEYCCHCGTVYDACQLISLGVLLSQFQLIQIKNDILTLHKSTLKGKCSKCRADIANLSDKIVINCSNTRNELINLLGITTFNHSLCKKCFSNSNQTKQYFCLYCKCDHSILKQMSPNSDEGFI